MFQAEYELLVSKGNSVSVFTRKSDEIRSQGTWGVIKGALATPWNPWVAASVRREVEVTKPDVVHVHNTFPLISPSIFSAIGKRAARVLTLHNYRLLCPAAIPMRAGQVCTQCLDQQSVFPSLKYGCYRDSRAATLPLAFNVALHRWLGTWRNEIDAFIVLSDFQKQLLEKAGLPEHKIHVKPNFHTEVPPVIPWTNRDDCVLFVGRLSAEKGVSSLIEAWRQWGSSAPLLRIIGDGPLRSDLELAAEGLPVEFLGQLPKSSAQEHIAKAKLLVLPSECFETFGLVVVEAFAHGTPVAVSCIGALPSLVEAGVNGVVFPPAQPSMILESIRSVWGQPKIIESMAQKSRVDFEKKYTCDVNYSILLDIYNSAIKESRRS